MLDPEVAFHCTYQTQFITQPIPSAISSQQQREATRILKQPRKNKYFNKNILAIPIFPRQSLSGPSLCDLLSLHMGQKYDDRNPAVGICVSESLHFLATYQPKSPSISPPYHHLLHKLSTITNIDSPTLVHWTVSQSRFHHFVPDHNILCPPHDACGECAPNRAEW